jgi:periplasmic divalent cation tolerance protein
MSFIAVYITHESIEAANNLTDALIEEKAIACANQLPIESAYWWQGAVHRESEIVTLVKSRAENWNYLQKRITELHPYDVPCIVCFDVSANRAYEEWIHEVTNPFPTPG